MSNVLPDRSIDDIRTLARAGQGIRAISRALGIGKNTVKKYYPRNEDHKCGCGRNAGHKGWCKFRYAKSVARQAFHAARSGKVITLPPKITMSRLSHEKKRQLKWLGADPSHNPSPVPYVEMYSIIGEVTHACKRFPREFRDDAVSEVIVGACEGRIPRDEITKAALFFMRREWGRVHALNLSIDQIADGHGYDILLVENPWDNIGPRQRARKHAKTIGKSATNHSRS